MRNLFLTLLLLTFSVRLWADESHLRFQSQYSYVDAGNYYGHLLGAQLYNQFSPKTSAYLGTQQLERTFTGGTTIRDETIDGGAVFSFTDKIYLESQVSIAPNAIILPQQSYILNPRMSVGNVDVGVGLTYREYKDVKAGGLNPSLIYFIRDNFKVGLGVYVFHTDSYLTSGSSYAQYDLNERHTFRVDGAGGETLEAAGLEATFTTVTGTYGIHFKHFDLQFFVNHYDSTLRLERSGGISLVFK